MASENGQGRRETLADIVAEILAYGAQPPPRLMWLEIADRIEAAHKRESAEWKAAACACVSDAVMSGKVAVEHVPVGNAAAMRKALVELTDKVLDYLHRGLIQLPLPLEDATAKARAALSAPARNCDKYDNFNDALRQFVKERPDTKKIDEQGRSVATAETYCVFANWLITPAAERKGEGDGR